MSKPLLSVVKGIRPCGLPACVLIFLAVAAAAWAAQVKSDPQKPLQYDVSVALKLVQVYVTGKGGQPVGDLTAEEFEVTDNGQRVPVTHFEKHFLGAPQETPAGPAPGPSLSRKFFLVFDFGFIDPHGVIKAKNAGLHFIDAELQPADEVGLLSYTAFRGLTLHEYLTTDHKKIRRIVDGFGLKSYAGRAENFSDFVYAVDLQEQIQLPLGGQGAPAEDFFQRQARLQTGQRVDEGARQGYLERAKHLVESLDNFARVIRYIPGYKNIVLFSGGLARQILYGKKGGAVLESWTTPEELAAQMSLYDAAQADGGLRSDFTNMLTQFKASNAPVFALDVSRAQKEADVTYNEGTGAVARELEGADSLRQFASATGGKFYANTMDYKRIMDNIQNVTGAFYVLGYSVSEKWDGKFHKIKVRVLRKGCDVIAQGGYFSPKPFKEYSSFEKLLHATDLALSDTPQLQIPGDIPVAATTVTAGGWPQIVAFARASKPAQNDVLGTKAEAYLLLLDESGEVSMIKRFKLSLPDEKLDITSLFPSFLLSVKPGRYTCRLVLRNMETGRGARGTAAIVVPAAAAAAPLVLDPPLLLAADTRSQDLAGSDAGLLSGIYGYDRNAYAPLAGAVPAGQTRLVAALRCSSNAPNPDFEISANLREAAAPAATDVPVSVIRKTQSGQTSLILTELATGELRPGRYTLQIVAKEKGGSETGSANLDFVVK
jgi:VWFA-related protein